MASTAGYRRGPLRYVWPSPARVASHRTAQRADEEYGAGATPDWRDIDWSQHRRQIEIAGRTVDYVDLGSGDKPPVVFVHGLGGCWQNWLECMPRLAQTRRVIALDLPGFGRSEMPAETISITGFAKTVDALADALELGPIAIVGNSMGGFTAAELAIRSPDRVERLVLVDAAGISVAAASRFARAIGRAILSRGSDRERVIRMLRRPGTTQMAFGVVMRHPTRIARDLLAEQLNGVGAEGFTPAVHAILGYDFRDRLSEIGCPTLVVQGTEDVLVPLGDAHEFERKIPLATTLVLEDTGHVPMLERPRAFNKALVEFLDQDVAPHEPDAAEAPTLASATEHAV